MGLLPAWLFSTGSPRSFALSLLHVDWDAPEKRTAAMRAHPNVVHSGTRDKRWSSSLPPPHKLVEPALLPILEHAPQCSCRRPCRHNKIKTTREQKRKKNKSSISKLPWSAGADTKEAVVVAVAPPVDKDNRVSMLPQAACATAHDAELNWHSKHLVWMCTQAKDHY